jgi:predicted nucleotidyltransferase
MELEEVKQKISPILSRFGIKRAAVFGSVARGEAKAGSDVDILIELYEPLGLFKFARLNYLLEDALDKKVDLIKNTAIKPAFRENILKDMVYIYG